MRDNKGAFSFFLIFAVLGGLFFWLFKRTGTAAQAATTPNPANGDHATITLANRPSVMPMQGTTNAAIGAGITAGTALGLGWFNSLFATPPTSQPKQVCYGGTCSGDSSISPPPTYNGVIGGFADNKPSSIDNLITSFTNTTSTPTLQTGVVLDPYNAGVYNISPANPADDSTFMF